MSAGRTPATGRRFRRTAALLLHWHDNEDTSAAGVAEVLREIDDIDGEWAERAGFVCALAELAWQMAKAPDQEAAGAYLRTVVRNASVDEVRTDA